jgi:hypothetical protein
MGRQSGNSYRTTISIPLDLKRRMDEVEGVNWSAVATRAFEEKLAEIATKKERKSMTDVVQRLRASKVRAQGKVYQEGYTAGRRWASEIAAAAELERMAEKRDELYKAGPNEWDRWFKSDAPGYDLLQAIAEKRIKDNAGPFMQHYELFWGQIIGIDDRTRGLPDYVRGFAEGALEVWDAVRDEL